jgi:hypothetical protein
MLPGGLFVRGEVADLDHPCLANYPLKDAAFKLNDQTLSARIRSFLIQQYLWTNDSFYMLALSLYPPVTVDRYNSRQTQVLAECQNNQSYCH